MAGSTDREGGGAPDFDAGSTESTGRFAVISWGFRAADTQQLGYAFGDCKALKLVS
jgi:hypothetical protein